MNKFIKSRKFWIMLIVFFLVWSGYWFTITSAEISEANIVLLFSACAACTTLFGIAGIGGYIWKDWIKSKYFQEKLNVV